MLDIFTDFCKKEILHLSWTPNSVIDMYGNGNKFDLTSEQMNEAGIPAFGSGNERFWIRLFVCSENGEKLKIPVSIEAEISAMAMSLSVQGWPTAPTPAAIFSQIRNKSHIESSMPPFFATLLALQKIDAASAENLLLVQAAKLSAEVSKMKTEKNKETIHLCRKYEALMNESISFVSAIRVGDYPKLSFEESQTSESPTNDGKASPV